MNHSKIYRWTASMLAAGSMALSILPSAVFAQDESDTTDVSARVSEIVDGMSLDEKITQMLMMDFRQWDNGSGAGVVDMTVLDDQVAEILSTYKFGSFILFANNIVETEATFDLTQAIQAAATADGGLPMLICTDQEGGSVYRLGSGTALPGNMALGATRSTDDAYTAGRIIGSEMSVLGINATLAPVVDVNNNANNPVIGLRSYSDDPELVGTLASNVIKGLDDYNVIGCCKHFPGHGDTDTDSHYGLPKVDKPKDVLMENELKPYTVAIEQGVDMIMTAHILYPQLDDSTIYSNKSGQEESVPATMSKAIITDLLKGELGFDGVVSTDAMNMSAIAATWDQVQATVNAIAAGADLICMPASPRTVDAMSAIDDIIQGIKDAIDDGTITMDRINDGVTRVVTLKAEKGILDWSADDLDLDTALSVVGGTENRENERHIAADAVTVVKNENNTLPITLEEDSKVLALVPYANERGQISMAWNRAIEAGTIPSTATLYNTDTFNGQTELTDDTKALIDTVDYVVIHSEVSNASRMYGNHWLSAYPLAAAAYCKEVGVPCIVMSVDKPYDVQMYDDADAVMAVYGCKGSSVDPTEAIVGSATGDKAAYGPNIIAGWEVVFGTMQAKGSLPVNIPKYDPTYDDEGNVKEYYSDELVYERGYSCNPEAKPIDTTNLEEAIALAGTLDGSNYVDFSGVVDAVSAGLDMLDDLHDKQCVNKAAQAILDAIDSLEVAPTRMHRLYNPNSGEHFYTKSDHERDVLIREGWIHEGDAWVAPAISGKPVFRLYNPNEGDHHYTMDEYEVEVLTELGWKYEGIGWYSDEAGGTPVYRAYNPNAKSGAHHFTTSRNEINALIRAGWKAEGIAWYSFE